MRSQGALCWPAMRTLPVCASYRTRARAHDRVGLPRSCRVDGQATRGGLRDTSGGSSMIAAVIGSGRVGSSASYATVRRAACSWASRTAFNQVVERVGGGVGQGTGLGLVGARKIRARQHFVPPRVNVQLRLSERVVSNLPNLPLHQPHFLGCGQAKLPTHRQQPAHR